MLDCNNEEGVCIIDKVYSQVLPDEKYKEPTAQPPNLNNFNF